MGKVETKAAGAPEHEVGVTPAMIAAGEAISMGYHTLFTNEAYWAKEIYRAMEGAASRLPISNIGDIIDRYITISLMPTCGL